MFIKRKLFLLGTCAVFSIGTQAGESGESASASAVLEEIIVTSQRREQSLQDVPVSVSVLSGEALEKNNLISLAGISSRLPNVNIASGVLTDIINIRGVGSGDDRGFEQAVGTFVDGVYRARSRSTKAALFDIDRLEVLKGPQSTFFGANTVAGALNIATRKPTGEFGYNLNTLYGFEDGEYQIEGGVNLPASDTLSFRLAARLSGMDGYIDNGANGDGPNNDTQHGRIAVLWEPVDNYKSEFRMDISKSETDNATPFEIIGCPASAPFVTTPNSSCDLYLQYNGGPVDDELDFRSASPYSFANYDFSEAVWTNTLEMENGSLSSITAYFGHEYTGLTHQIPFPIVSPIAPGAFGMPYHESEDYNQISQEVRYQSELGGNFEYMVGAYYAKSDLDYDGYFGLAWIPFGGIPPIAATGTNALTPISPWQHQEEETETRSVFAAATYSLNDVLRINLGLRYSSIRKEAYRSNLWGAALNGEPELWQLLPYTSQLALSALTNSGYGTFPNPKRTDDELMPSIGFQYDVSDEVMIYSSYSKGFKAGGYSISSSISDFEPETVDSYELGLKGYFLDHKLSVNAALFRNEYDNLQEASVVFAGLIPYSTVQNAAKSTSQGLELGAVYAANENVTLMADVGYLSSKYDDFPNGQCTLEAGLSGCQLQDMSGKDRGYAPEFSGNIGASIIIPLEGGEISIAPSIYFSSSYFQSATADSLLKQGGYAKLDLRLAYGPSDGSWEIALVGKNLTDKITSSYRRAVTGTSGTIQAIPERSRSIGIQFKLNH